MAVWCRKPKNRVLIYSDQGGQFTSRDWASVLRTNTLKHSLSRHGNCHDSAVLDCFFNLLKRKRRRRRVYKTRAEERRTCWTISSSSACTFVFNACPLAMPSASDALVRALVGVPLQHDRWLY